MCEAEIFWWGWASLMLWTTSNYVRTRRLRRELAEVETVLNSCKAHLAEVQVLGRAAATGEILKILAEDGH